MAISSYAWATLPSQNFAFLLAKGSFRLGAQQPVNIPRTGAIGEQAVRRFERRPGLWRPGSVNLCRRTCGGTRSL